MATAAAPIAMKVDQSNALDSHPLLYLPITSSLAAILG